MALKTAKRCKEKSAGRVGHPVERFDEAGRSRLRVLSGYGGFARQRRCKPLKTRRFPAGLRLVSEQIRVYHFNLVYGSIT
ncbi:hypothetical protein [Stappia sediminis]|uniref:hypothetical protein n=1 Tax=Stappia sediminis TaxID=2692190 RepID=UPI001AD91E5C|nr:hypothetical protein [Stappia sediminis]